MNDETHPELRPGEIWITNATNEAFRDLIGYKTKRLGNIAYYASGSPINDNYTHPVFVEKSEYDADQQKHLWGQTPEST